MVQGETMKSNTLVMMIFAGTALFGSCANADTTGERYDNANPRYIGVRSNEGFYGVVDSIESARSASKDSAIAGTVIGGVIGGVLGHQVGGGTGNSVATLAGAVGGAVVGHEIGQSRGDADAFRVRVRFENGSYQTVTQSNIGDLRIGDSVRIDKDRVFRY
jgi:outer membrane lipoprotein SlyB